mgnify:CR=1 FL=1
MPFGDVDAGFAAAKLVLDETFVTSGLGHHSMEPRSALAYWQNGKCFLHGSTQSQSFVFPGIARRLGISVKTVEAHTSSTLRKLQLSTRHELTRWATERNLLD